MENYQEARVKLTNTQLKKVKSAAKNKTGTILGLNKKKFEDEELPHELFITKRQTTKMRNTFANNTLTNIKLSKTQISKIIQSGESFVSWLANLRKKALTNVAVPRHNLPGIVINLTSNAINKFERKISGKGTVRAGKLSTLVISNEDINDIFKIIKRLEDSGVLIDGVTETVKHEIKKTKRRIFWSFTSTFSRFISTIGNLFSSKRYKWKRSWKIRKRIYR